MRTRGGSVLSQNAWQCSSSRWWVAMAFLHWWSRFSTCGRARRLKPTPPIRPLCPLCLDPLGEEVRHRVEVDAAVLGGGGAGVAENAVLGQGGHPLAEDDLAHGLVEGADVSSLRMIHAHEIGPQEE